MEAASTGAAPPGAGDATPLIELRDLEVHYKARGPPARAVDGVSLELARRARSSGSSASRAAASRRWRGR